MPEIVNTRNFLLSIRETGYRSLAHSIAEFVDNSLQANSTSVSIDVRSEHGGVVSITDNGIGMSQDSLRTALQFGGSTRFNDRNGAGRFGMGLPTSSVSLAKRVDVYTWKDDAVLHSYLDIDELQESGSALLHEPDFVIRPSFLPRTAHGTSVILSRCDRAKLNQVVGAEQAKIELSRIFRFPIKRFLTLKVNGEILKPFDPLFLSTTHLGASASSYGPALEYKMLSGKTSATIQVRFTRLPVNAWRDMSSSDKKKFGVSRGAGASIVRNEREIAYGWYFFGDKRRENYDDWWRCEIKFTPELDEHFGVDHTKQHINPSAELDCLLTPDLENIARMLNAAVRQEFVRSARPRRQSSARTASSRDKYLPSLLSSEKSPIRGLAYRIEVERGMGDNSFYRTELLGSEVVVWLNAHHPVTPWYLATKSDGASQAKLFEFLILAAARTELGASTARQRWWFRHFRTGWGDALAVFLGN